MTGKCGCEHCSTPIVTHDDDEAMARATESEGASEDTDARYTWNEGDLLIVVDGKSMTVEEYKEKIAQKADMTEDAPMRRRHIHIHP